MMDTCRGIFRLAHLVLHLFKGLFLSYTKLHGTQSHDLNDDQQNIITSWLHRSAEIIGVNIQVHGKSATAPCFIVSNHISWLDILIIASVLPVSFLSKAEVRNWSIIGTLAAKAGTLFIQRGSKNGATEAIELMRVKLLAGHNVASFPEAKTTYGKSIHTFHPRLFAAAVETNTLVQPIAIRYPHPNGINPIVPYVEEPNFIKHAFKIMCAKYTVAEVTLCDPIEAKGMERKELAQLAKISISNVIEKSSTQANLT